jgi:hypothetical protein
VTEMNISDAAAAAKIGVIRNYAFSAGGEGGAHEAREVDRGIHAQQETVDACSYRASDTAIYL